MKIENGHDKRLILLKDNNIVTNSVLKQSVSIEQLNNSKFLTLMFSV